MKNNGKSRFGFVLMLAAVMEFLTMDRASAAESIGVPDLTAHYVSKPALDVYPSFVQASAFLMRKETDKPAYELMLRTGYTPNGKGGAEVNPAITKVQLESDVSGHEYFGIFQLIDGRAFSIVKDGVTNTYWLHGKTADGQYKAAVCRSYDGTTGLVAGCQKAQPRIAQASVVAAADFARALSENMIPLAASMDGFNPPPPQKSAETAAYIVQQRQNANQLKN